MGDDRNPADTGSDALALVAWLKDQIAADRELARCALGGHAAGKGPVWRWDSGDRTVFYGNIAVAQDGTGTYPRNGRLIAEFDPARVLREVAAKRAMIEQYEAMQVGVDAAEGTVLAGAARIRLGAYLKTLQALAGVYSDRPGFRAEWETS